MEVRYSPDNRDVKESKDTVILGEDPDDADEESDQVPIRILSDFCVFDRNDDYGIRSMDDVQTRRLEAAGYVAPLVMEEEDAGQEDDIEDEDPQRIHTTTIQRYTFDYESIEEQLKVLFHSPMYILTQSAWYQLRRPSKIYSRCFYDFYRPHRVAQTVLSAVKENPTITWKEYSELHVDVRDPLLETRITKHHVYNAIPLIVSLLRDLPQSDEPQTSQLIRHLLSEQTDLPPRLIVPSAAPALPSLRNRSLLTGNIDLAILRPENQSHIHVTPLIDQLAYGLFQEHLQVVGAKPPNKRNYRQAAAASRAWLIELLFQWRDRDFGQRKPQVWFSGEARIQQEYWRSIEIDARVYSVGDIILAPAGPDDQRHEPAAKFPNDPNSIAADASIADYFWFGHILWINQKSKQIHVQWFDHSSQSCLEEIGDPQELFLTDTCGTIDVSRVVCKATVHWKKQAADSARPSEFYCSYLYYEIGASFTEIQDDYFDISRDLSPPDNCPVCLKQEQQERDEYLCTRQGFKLRGVNYHVYDFVLLQSVNGPADVAQLLNVPSLKRSRTVKEDTVRVRSLGRISDIFAICPANMIKDERHFFFTEIEEIVSVARIVRKCFVVHRDAPLDRNEWLSLSPYHFYVHYCFRGIDPTEWSEKHPLQCSDFPVCRPCFEEDKNRDDSVKKYLISCQKNPLKAFDPFGGVGAFGLGMEEAGCIKMVHAIEISPSAAKTLKKHSPETIVHNQDANVVLQYAIKKHAGHNSKPPKEIEQPAQSLPDPPKPGDIDCIVAGFPCQPHSRLNMFQKANDRKSHMFLNLLSWIDFLKPKYCFVENVSGFLSYKLNATQAGRYRVEGGIEMGGLKFLVRALLAMSYQVRFGLLQAAHYGTPQSRIRFILIAARQGSLLPELPQPTHDFPLKNELSIKFPNAGTAKPIRTANGVAPFRFVTIDDAISDLPRFHWRDPHKLIAPRHGHRTGETPAPEEQDLELPCDHRSRVCGLQGVVKYQHPPRTNFQAKCRAKPTRDLQHFTRIWKEATVERVVNIPLKARADYRDLPVELHEWQAAHPSSATARDGFRPGLYGRLDKDEWFHTTVTNVEPTAKQSWVLNPYCRRMLTVRELARSQGFPDSFVFYSLYDDIKTMHRQIGNAVPWQLGAALGLELREVAWTKWKADLHDAIVVD
ncbi:S-adenosyl-L-methionine-dependent methyltransferase [Laetiporus sulphureus 93-53]|uniref:DNA (cytosine-5-)-methyltransferase n=1 Tax=Laetiporus sulphureus 93-53 TaxID=1314785 RepID=A0A165FWV5_9APHY|nr:S-adenosyl-L-methionine-dependent methyltransferase [Laetiporus sulphureus 93-53]KZT09519.1 S-adenosyl-L-methionine-dependent methyltransferase [Laetiporus sulphureus 93-53]